ncbi:MAG: thiol peroxidase [Muribaculaceae bacterium]|nr:thiol peroxidase [Muribaculaceae bacterium]
METVYFKGIPCHTYGNVPRPGQEAPDFSLVNRDLTDVTAADFKDKRIVLNIFPSLDTPVCAASVRRFNQEAASVDNTVVVCVSMDLPFAQERFCEANNINNVIVTSAFRSPEFAQKYGLLLTDGPLKGLLSRAVIIMDKGKVIYTDVVNEITDEPDYESAISVLNRPI